VQGTALRPSDRESTPTKEQAMSDTTKTETSGLFQVPAWEFAKAGSHATEQACNQAQAVAKAITDWNAECHRFVSHRMSRNGDAAVKIAKSQNLPEMLAVQSKWLEDVIEDYIKETSMLVELNKTIMSGLMPQVAQAFQSSARAPTKA
jgi:hypothetical protein